MIEAILNNFEDPLYNILRNHKMEAVGGSSLLDARWRDVEDPLLVSKSYSYLVRDPLEGGPLWKRLDPFSQYVPQ